jgi:hypothetical protein
MFVKGVTTRAFAGEEVEVTVTFLARSINREMPHPVDAPNA